MEELPLNLDLCYLLQYLPKLKIVTGKQHVVQALHNFGACFGGSSCMNHHTLSPYHKVCGLSSAKKTLNSSSTVYA